VQTCSLNAYEVDYFTSDGKLVAELIHARLSIEVEAEAEGEVEELLDTGAEEKTASDALDDESDPEIMDAAEEE
jgi:peptidyl-tRNA hydrolase